MVVMTTTKNGSYEEHNPFGVHYKDGDAEFGLNTNLTPRYMCDAVSRKLTREMETEYPGTRTTDNNNDNDGLNKATLA